MTINGTNIKNLGFFLSEVTGLYDQPARKRILQEPEFLATDIIFDAPTVSVKIAGQFATTALLTTAVNNLLALLRGAGISFYFINYNKTIVGQVTHGAKVTVDLLVTTITFEIQ